MTETASGGGRSGQAALAFVATAITGYLPAGFLYDWVRGWVSPMRHAEEAMGRGLEVMFIAAPLGALSLAMLAAWLVYRDRLAVRTVVIAGLAAMLAAFAVMR